MPIRFRKSVTIFPGVRLNFSKSGMSVSVGKRGAFTLNFSKRGVRQTTDLPGEGLYHTSYLFKNSDDDQNEKKKDAEEEQRSSDASADKPKRRTRRSSKEGASSPWSFVLFVVIALFFFYFGADALGLLPPNMVADLLARLTHWAREVGL